MCWKCIAIFRSNLRFWSLAIFQKFSETSFKRLYHYSFWPCTNTSMFFSPHLHKWTLHTGHDPNPLIIMYLFEQLTILIYGVTNIVISCNKMRASSGKVCGYDFLETFRCFRGWLFFLFHLSPCWFLSGPFTDQKVKNVTWKKKDRHES